MKCLEVYNYKRKVRKGYLKRRQVSTTKCATLPQSVCTSFLEYKVMQILYNKLTQAHLPTTTAKPSNSQMDHIKIRFFSFFLFFLATISHITQEINQQKTSGQQHFWFLENNIRSVSTTSDCLYELQRLTYCITMYSNHINIYKQKYTKTIFIQKGLMPNGSLRL